MRFTDRLGRKIETRSGENVIAEDGFPVVELYVDNQFVDELAMMNYSPQNVSAIEDCLFEEYEIEVE